MWETIVGGAVALAGVALAQWWQSRRAREDAEMRLAVDKAARLRSAYLEAVSESESMRERAFDLLPFGADVERKVEEWSALVDKLTEAPRPISTAKAALLVEADEEDRAVVAAFRTAEQADSAFKLALTAQAMTPGDESRRAATHAALSTLEAAVDKVAKLARERLAELETPPRRASGSR